ncbi:MAG: mlr13, partial [Mycobacterium sp.]|nr:mlr13 [Mycobacterium sp.]
NWIVDGDPGLDLWPFDVRRFGVPQNVPTVLDLASVQAYGHYYEIAFPNRPGNPPRGQRRSAVHHRLRERGAVFGVKFGYERALWFSPGAEGTEEIPTFGRSNAWDFVAAEHRAVRTGVGIVDASSFSKFDISGAGALTLLQRLAGADMDTAVGKVTYTQLLNVRGGIEADVTITRLGTRQFYLVTGSGFGRHDVTFLLQHAPTDGSVVIADVTSAHGVLNVCGPRSRDVLAVLSTDDFSSTGFRYMTARRTDVGWAPVLALRTTYVGELGWELHIPTEYVCDVYDKVMEAGALHGIRDIGYRAVETLRLEKQYLAWATDMRSDNNPFEVGLGGRCRPDKPGLLAGPALEALAGSGPSQHLHWFRTDADVVMHGAEMLVHLPTGTRAGVRSAGYGHTVDATLFSAYLPAALDTGSAATFEVEVMNVRHPATRLAGPSYDPSGERVRS